MINYLRVYTAGTYPPRFYPSWGPDEKIPNLACGRVLVCLTKATGALKKY